MAREIKFRIWDGSQMNYHVLAGKLGSYYASIDPKDTASVINTKYPENIIPMQFTGFKDKNGKEIYEGDKIGDWVEVDGKMEQSKLQVYFDEMLGQWMLDNSLTQNKELSYSLFAELSDFEYEVIGNIYE